MIRIDIATLFVDMCENVLRESIIGRARKNNLLEINCYNIRDYSNNKHNRVDDATYGGGVGMLMAAQPIYNCYKSVTENVKKKPYVIYVSPQGKPFTQKHASTLASYDHLFIICGHYEGIDQRLIDKIVDEEISIGDYVLTGGELAALVITDAVSRLCEGVLPKEVIEESHYSGLLEYPQYTRPRTWEGMDVPEILLSGHDAKIAKWRHEKSLENTFFKRKDLIDKFSLTKEEEVYINWLKTL